MPALRRLFPNCRVIHIYRDGRDVWRSWRSISVGPSNVYAAATRWARFVAAGQAAARDDPGCLEVRYETLITEPEATLHAVCAFLEEPFDAAMVRPAPPPPGGARDRPAGDGIARENLGRWRTALPEWEQRVFEAVAGETLDALGDEVRGDPTSPGRLARARWAIDDAGQWVRRRLVVEGRLELGRTSPASSCPWARLHARLGLGRRRTS